MPGKNQHVVPHEGKWAVKGEGNQHISTVHETQCEAIEQARKLARLEKREVLVHDRQGEIRLRETYRKVDDAVVSVCGSE
jgi:Uncharacterized protein conserved in bacteria (DUF2188)